MMMQVKGAKKMGVKMSLHTVCHYILYRAKEVILDLDLVLEPQSMDAAPLPPTQVGMVTACLYPSLL